MGVLIIGLLLWVAPAILLALLLAYTALRIRGEGKAGTGELRDGEPARGAAPAEARPGLPSGS